MPRPAISTVNPTKIMTVNVPSRSCSVDRLGVDVGTISPITTVMVGEGRAVCDGDAVGDGEAVAVAGGGVDVPVAVGVGDGVDVAGKGVDVLVAVKVGDGVAGDVVRRGVDVAVAVAVEGVAGCDSCMEVAFAHTVDDSDGLLCQAATHTSDTTAKKRSIVLDDTL